MYRCNVTAHMEHSYWKNFLDLCLQSRSRGDLDRLLQLFLTHEERNDLAKRLLIVEALLEEKLTQREIARKCRVSIAKITRGSNALKVIDPKLKTSLSAYLLKS